MSDEVFDTFRDPSRETSLRWQGDKETLGGSAHRGPPPWKEGDRLNDFVLECLLGSGSSGFVYRALDVKTNRRCALKLLTDTSPDDLLRNKLGFRRMMSIEHPNLLRVDRIYQLGSNIALSMEEIDGVTLTSALQRFATMESERAYQQLLVLMRDYASGLAMMHAHGYIHRDIKPDNLMVDRNGRGRVIDYGLVDAFELEQASLGARGFLLGTPHYFAPEVIWSQQYLPAGDIFSLGIVMLDALAVIQSKRGLAQSELERCDSSAHHDADRIDEAIGGLSESVPTTIREACREMLERLPSDRPTAMELSRLGVPRSKTMAWPHEEPLVGRDAERREIVAWVEDIFCGNVGRLHLTGPSGIGKSRLIEQVIHHIESKHWGQVFSARCRVREDQPLQAFDQICDAITNRYMRGDRERLELDPVSVGMLQEIFPVLKSVFKCNLQLATGSANVEPMDAMEAAARLSDQLRLVGPLFLVIDDVQWADRDSLNVLDRLQTAVGREGLGIITISRDRQDPQRLSANKYVHLEPLELENSIEILLHAAQRWGVGLSAQSLRKLAEATGGSPFRLRELADEFRSGGALSRPLQDAEDPQTAALLDQVGALWKQRAGRLSRDAKNVLTYVVTSGGHVSTQQLGELTGLDDAVDAAVSELARQRLITDEATGGECISIFHDHVADELIKTLSEEAIAQAHHEWATLLSQQDHPESLAARIAGHFFAAAESDHAVPHALIAAEDAERRAAISEAARWYSRVIDHLNGPEKVEVIRSAARCFRKADLPVLAAGYYQRLAELVDQDESLECQILAVVLLVRCGRLDAARDQLTQIAKLLSLPRPKPDWQSKLALLIGHWRNRFQVRRSLVRTVRGTPSAGPESRTQDRRESDPSIDFLGCYDKTRFPPVSQTPRASKQIRALRFCNLLIRPLSMSDNLYAAELSLAASRMARKHGDQAQRFQLSVGEAVYKCYDRGTQRIQGESSLLALKPSVDRLRCAFTSAELWAGMAFSHALACRWDQVSQPVQASLQSYQRLGNTHGFELSHTQWIHLWAKWNLGKWRSMRSVAERMLHDSLRRSDLLQQRLACSGFGCNAFLASDSVERLERLRTSDQEQQSRSNQIQVFDLLDWIASIQILLYQGRTEEAWDQFESREADFGRSPLSRVQLFRVTRAWIGGFTAVHNLSPAFRDRWRWRTQVRIDQLRHEHLSYATTLADFLEGLLQDCVARNTGSQGARRLAIERVSTARGRALHNHLRPYQLAAGDKLSEIETGRSSGLLEQRMARHGIVRPASFLRLYTLPSV